MDGTSEPSHLIATTEITTQPHFLVHRIFLMCCARRFLTEPKRDVISNVLVTEFSVQSGVGSDDCARGTT